MGKYSDKLVDKYIMGFPIDNVDELENSKSFMMQAIDKSCDYRLYNLCSDKVKKNYSFVKYIVLKFNNNLDFVCNVADYYLENSSDELSRIELVVIMEFLSKRNKEKYMHYRMIGHSLYYLKRLQIETSKKTVDDQELIDEIGMGFLLIFEEYTYNKIVLDFFAKKIIDGIFDENDIDLEYMLHEQFNSPDEINKIGINNYMIKFINGYDSMLADYLMVHTELMNELRDKINYAIENWRKFEIRNEREKYNRMFEEVHEYLMDKETLFDETTVIYYIGRKLGIADKILKYDSIYTCSLDDVFEEIDNELVKEILEISFEERIHLNNVKKIMIDNLFSKVKREELEKSKIIKIDFNKKRNKL